MFYVYLKNDYTFKKAENTAPIRSTYPIPLLGENPGPIGRGTSLHPKQQAYSQDKGDQELGQVTEGSKHIILLKRKSRY